jgi:hypothetical protein
MEEKPLVIKESNIKESNSIYFDQSSKESAFKMADFMKNMSMLPESYQGNVNNCMFAIGIAKQLNIDPVYVMQNSQMIKGHFTWSGKAFKSMIDNNPLFSQIQYIEVGTPSGKKDPNGIDIPIHDDNWGIYLQAFDKRVNKFVWTEPITIKMAKNEGWYGKTGSKWLTMPKQMMMYRAASFFVNSFCPSLSLGFQSAEELNDISKDNTSSKNVLNLINGKDN